VNCYYVLKHQHKLFCMLYVTADNLIIYVYKYVVIRLIAGIVSL